MVKLGHMIVIAKDEVCLAAGSFRTGWQSQVHETAQVVLIVKELAVWAIGAKVRRKNNGQSHFGESTTVGPHKVSQTGA